ncbi:gamma-interferon-inducible lysosomal thiol reductase [Procambarus clarkii]|uniref:gamma-interferon-inducible lysosomal thiol reductase n=1 Tax=Procambarus clarkii TaxID=6728 RepID=UPI001E675F9D|nr:gamma-interferon-inducible lysosomal thiol reductase-like [Procambarus clarkii]
MGSGGAGAKPHLLLLLLLLLHLSSVIASSAEPEAVKVKVLVFYESLCPDSRRFILNQLYPAWPDLKNITELDIYSYGKAVEYGEGADYNHKCQHGYRECQANTMLTCAKKYINDSDQFLDFARCVMYRFSGIDSGPVCANETCVEWSGIEKCYSGQEGHLLQHQVGLLQATLQPRLDYVPWILINNKFTREQLTAAQEDLRTAVCEAYQGTKPSSCQT